MEYLFLKKYIWISLKIFLDTDDTNNQESENDNSGDSKKDEITDEIPKEARSQLKEYLMLPNAYFGNWKMQDTINGPDDLGKIHSTFKNSEGISSVSSLI